MEENLRLAILALPVHMIHGNGTILRAIYKIECATKKYFNKLFEQLFATRFKIFVCTFLISILSLHCASLVGIWMHLLRCRAYDIVKMKSHKNYDEL